MENLILRASRTYPLRGALFKTFAGARGLKDKAQGIRHGAQSKKSEVGGQMVQSTEYRTAEQRTAE